MVNLINRIDVAMGRKKADIVLKNASIINVFTQLIDKGDIAISQDTIIGIGNYDGETEIDCEGLFIAPGLIDAHVHIESSMVTPEVFSHLLIKRGVTTIVSDPHEIANVMGNEGIQLMLNSGAKGAIDTYFMLPSCVPAIYFEDNGATLNAEDLAQFCDDAKVLGIGEVMDVHAVTDAKEEMLDKILLAINHGKNIDGHCPKVNGKELNAYLCAGIKTDHECTDPEEALEKVKNGMYVMLREGSAAKDLVNLLPAVNSENYHRFMFCTDDRHIEDLMEDGSIDNCVRLAIREGLDPIKAFTMGSFNAASCYHLENRGAIAPGMKADLIIFEDLEKLQIKHVMKDGVIYEDKDIDSHIETKKSVNLDYIKEDCFHVKVLGEYINVIKVQPGSLRTSKVIRKIQMKNDIIEKVIEEKEPVNKIAVFERHKNSGKYFTGYIEGLGIKGAAIAQTIAHDSHNVIVLGDNDLDMKIAVNHLIDLDGGIVIVSGGELLEFISLPIAGVMTSENPKIVLNKIKRLNLLAREHGIKMGIDPFITLGFMALPVIPDLKITPRGLFHYSSFQIIDLFPENEIS